MMESGPHGGTPMVSKPGKQTIANYVCFSNGVKLKDEDEFELDPAHVPMHIIEEKLRMELKGYDHSFIANFVQQVKEQWTASQELPGGGGKKDKGTPKKDRAGSDSKMTQHES